MSMHQAIGALLNDQELPRLDRRAAQDPLYAVDAATKRRTRTQEEWEESLKNAAKTHSLRTIAGVAGVSHARVAQIVGSRG